MYTHPKGGNYPEYNALLIEQNKLNQRTQNKTCGQIWEKKLNKKNNLVGNWCNGGSATLQMMLQRWSTTHYCGFYGCNDHVQVSIDLQAKWKLSSTYA